MCSLCGDPGRDIAGDPEEGLSISLRVRESPCIQHSTQCLKLVTHIPFQTQSRLLFNSSAIDRQTCLHTLDGVLGGEAEDAADSVLW